jgi:hypothetical protein
MIVNKWHRRAASLLIAGAVLAPGAAFADAPTPQERTLAESLFRDAKKLVAAKKYTEACPMLAESQRLDPGGGTLLNLAACHASLGMTATAWGEFSQALAEAKRDGRADRVKAAETQIAALEPQLARLTVVVHSEETAPTEVELDARPLPSVTWGHPFPVDPGPHVLKEHAPGREPHEEKVDIVARAQKTVELPPLAPAVAIVPVVAAIPPPVIVAAPPAADTDASPSDPHRARRIAGFATGAVGVVGLGVGTYLALHAIALHSDSNQGCTPGCTATAVSQNNDARTSANLANVGFGVGIAGLAVGTYLVLTSRAHAGSPAAKAAAAFLPIVSVEPRGAGLGWAQTF